MFMLCLAFKNFITSTMYFKCKTQARIRYIDITHAVLRNGSALCRSLSSLHAFTGCGSVSVFAWKEKLSTLKLAKQYAKIRELFQVLGSGWIMKDEMLHDFKSSPASCTAQILALPISTTYGTVSSLLGKETSNPTK